MLTCDHQVAWEDFRILQRESNRFMLELKESLFITRENTTLKRDQFSKELILF